MFIRPFRSMPDASGAPTWCHAVKRNAGGDWIIATRESIESAFGNQAGRLPREAVITFAPVGFGLPSGPGSVVTASAW